MSTSNIYSCTEYSRHVGNQVIYPRRQAWKQQSHLKYIKRLLLNRLAISLKPDCASEALAVLQLVPHGHCICSNCKAALAGTAV